MRAWSRQAPEELLDEYAEARNAIRDRPRQQVGRQKDTVVVGGHRGRGLGRWVKAAMLRRLVTERRGLKYVTTMIATNNTHMACVNHQVGFHDTMTMLVFERAITGLVARLRE